MIIIIPDEHNSNNIRHFRVERDAYGVSVKDLETGHQVCLEVFNGQLKALVHHGDRDEPVVNYDFPAPMTQDEMIDETFRRR